MGRVFLAGVGWIWARSAGNEKIALYRHFIPGPSVFFHSKAVSFSFSGYGIGHVYSPFSMGSDFFPTVISTPHGRHFRPMVISMGGSVRQRTYSR